MESSLQSPMPLVRADGGGYTYAGEWIDGFADRPELPLPVRVRLARLGERYAPKKLSTAQRDLLASPLAERDATRQPSAELDGFQANAQEIERAFEDGVYAELTPEQQMWVADPSSHPALAEDARYPLTLGQLHLLTGASERQLRHWTDEDLIPSHRAGAHRRYHSAAVARSLLLADASPQQVATLIALRKGGEHGRRLWTLIGGIAASLADVGSVEGSERDRIRQWAQALVAHRDVLASAGFANIRLPHNRRRKVVEMSKDSNMQGGRSRDEDGRLREKRGDTLVRTIEEQYDVDLGVRGDMRLDTYRERTGLNSIKEIVENARQQ
jgi:DNA-binding transcriptional MerR regulator